MDKWDVRPPLPKAKTANFSGGNQQKLVIAREVEQDPDVLLIGQPRITSYNVCYTKLLRASTAGWPVKPSAPCASWSPGPPGGPSPARRPWWVSGSSPIV